MLLILPLSLIHLLRTAPEHINLSKAEREGSSQKADVYSYGIILQEIATRSKPFLDGPMRPRGKINAVTTPFASVGVNILKRAYAKFPTSVKSQFT